MEKVPILKGKSAFVIPAAIFGIFASILILGSGLVTFDTSPETVTSEGVGYEGTVCTAVVKADGTYIDNGCQHNLLTRVGANATVLLLRDGGDPFINIGLCNVTNGTGCNNPADTDTALTFEFASCGLERTAGTTAIPVGTGNLTIYNEFTSTCGVTQLVNQTGLFNTSSLGTNNGTLLAINNFNTVALDNLDRLTINWTIQVS